MTKVVLYCRVSSDEQVQDGRSLETQEKRLRSLASVENWDIVDLYVDEGVSGGTDQRPRLQDLLMDARARRFELVVCTKLDRFFRETRLLLNFIYSLKQSGVHFIAYDDGIDTRKPGTGDIVLSLLGSIAEFERKRIGQRIKEARALRASKGQWSSGRTPFGYRFDKTTKQLVVEPSEAETIRYAFEQFTGPEPIGIIRLAERLNQAGCMPPVNSRKHRKYDFWTQTTARHIIKHPAYQGGPNDTWQFNSPPIIDKNIWQLAQHRLASNRHFKPAFLTRSIFHGKLKCGICGRTLRIGFNHSVKAVYECPGRLKREHLDNSPRCTLPRLPVAEVDAKLETLIKELTDNPLAYLKYLEDTLNNLTYEQKSLESRMKPLDKEAEDIRKKITVCNTRLEMNTITPEIYKERVFQYQKRLAELESAKVDADPCLIRDIQLNEQVISELKSYISHIESIQRKNGIELKSDDYVEKLTPTEYVSLVKDAMQKCVEQERRNNRPLNTPMLRMMDIQSSEPKDVFKSVIVYPNGKVELKGVLGKQYVSPGYTNDISLPISISLVLSE